VSLPAAKALPIPTTTTDVVLAGGLLIVRGWAFKNLDPANPASVELYDGTGTNGALIVPIDLLASESTRDWLSGSGIGAMAGLYLHVVKGTVQGSIWYSAATLEDDFAFVDGTKPFWTGEL
jgi:hypothetical protein